MSLPLPARSPDLGIWMQPVASHHLARNLFSNQTPSHRRHLVQHWHPYQQPKFNSCAITIQPPLAVTSASGQPYWSEGEGHREMRPHSELADFVIDEYLGCGRRANYQLMTLTVNKLCHCKDRYQAHFTGLYAYFINITPNEIPACSKMMVVMLVEGRGRGTWAHHGFV